MTVASLVFATVIVSVTALYFTRIPHPSPGILSSSNARLATTPIPASTTTPSPSITPVPAPIPTPNPGLKFGIAAGGGLSYLSSADLDARFKGMRALGVLWVRFDIDWSQVQPSSSSAYVWDGNDRVVSALRANGLNGLGVITYAPSWARASQCSASKQCSPGDLAAFAKFSGIAAARYALQGIHTWEVWNEPNTTDFWLPAANSSTYTQLLKLSYVSIKHSDPKSIILTGGLARTGTGNGSIAPADFIAGIYANGGKGYFDAVSDHPYSYPFMPEFSWQWNAWQQIANTQQNIRSVMVGNGDGEKKIWITEFGAPTGGPGALATNGLILAEKNDDHVSESLQVKILTSAVSEYRSFPWVGPFFWFSYQDIGVTQNDTENFYGLLRADGSKKPAYYSYQNAIKN